MSIGTYTRDFYILPTILYHNGDGIYKSVEFAWLKFYIGIAWKPVSEPHKKARQKNEQD